MWTDERINQIADVAANQSLTRVGVAELMAGYMQEMRNEWRKLDDERLAQILGKNEVIDELNETNTILKKIEIDHGNAFREVVLLSEARQARIAELELALDNALMEAAALDTLNQECRKDNERLRQSVNQQHAELVGWRQRDLVKVI